MKFAKIPASATALEHFQVDAFIFCVFTCFLFCCCVLFFFRTNWCTPEADQCLTYDPFLRLLWPESLCSSCGHGLVSFLDHVSFVLPVVLSGCWSFCLYSVLL